VKPMVRRYRGPLDATGWVWSCDSCSWGPGGFARDHATTFAAAHRHAKSLMHQLHATLLDRARRAGWTR
jgi:hypothetical protein